jgi:hypothetical protein
MGSFSGQHRSVSGSLRPPRLFRYALVSQLVEHALFGECIEEYLLAQLGVEATVASTDELQVVTSALAGRWESAPGHVGVDDEEPVWLGQGARTRLVRS